MSGLFDGLVARLGTAAGRGTIWTLAMFGGSQVLRLVSTLILTRLLFPEAFGLMALVSVFLFGLEMLTDAGISQSIIRHKRGDEEAFQNTAWTLQAVRGIVLFLCACMIAIPIAHLYTEPQLAILLPAAATSTLLLGFRSLSIPLANRRMVFARPAILELFSAVVGLVATIAAAVWLRSVWAIVIGGFVGAVARLVGSYTFVNGPICRFSINRSDLSEILHYGKWIELIGILQILLL